MKICPTCRKTYEDDGLNFCLDDGSVLTFTSADAAPTVVMEHARQTTAATGPGWVPQNPPAYSMQPKRKSSKTWVWLLAIFAILILACGGGFVGLFFWSVANSNVSVNKNATNPPPTRSNNSTRPTPSTSPVETVETREVDLAGWVDETTTSLEKEFRDGEFFMTSKQEGYYYVLVAKNTDLSDGNLARVTVRNVEGGDVSMGYGLVFHSDTTPLENDYAFLIDTKRKKYRVVRHQSDEEKTITGWTSSNLIKEGSAENVLEARTKGDKIELYINGQLATTITNKQGPKSGVPGLYVGDGSKIGFKNLEVVQ